jgi:heme/copper-type cytochrome/quinol oxidase subunit 3
MPSAVLAAPPVREAIPRARPVENGVLGMAIFLATEAMLFAALISSFLILRAGSAAWPPPGQPRLPVALTGLNTLVLLASGWTMWRAAESTRRGERSAVLRWIGATALLGTIFLIVQGAEWVRLLGYGLGASSSVYGGMFYTLIGCHALHVLAAVLALFYVLARTVGRRLQPTSATLDACRLYWLFVVGVWPILYVLVYLG